MQNDLASRFLSMLDPAASTFTFQTVPEPKGKHTSLWPQVLHGSLNDLLPKLTDLNRQGAAIYVTVNETDGKGRKAANITRLRAIWQDDDCGYEGDFPLQPSMIISSSPGKFQRYWLSEGLSKKDYKGLMGTMISEYGSDKDCGTDLARVLRVPGFYHQKAEPYLIRIVEASGRRYTGQELLKAFPPIEELPPQHFSFVAPPSQSNSEDTFRIKSALKLIDPDPYDQWLRVGQILHDFYEGQVEGLYVWMGWAQGSNKFIQKEHAYKWRTFGRSTGRQLGLGALFRMANKVLYGSNEGGL